jgi:hypothetical protein
MGRAFCFLSDARAEIDKARFFSVRNRREALPRLRGVFPAVALDLHDIELTGLDVAEPAQNRFNQAAFTHSVALLSFVMLTNWAPILNACRIKRSASLTHENSAIDASPGYSAIARNRFGRGGALA